MDVAVGNLASATDGNPGRIHPVLRRDLDLVPVLRLFGDLDRGHDRQLHAADGRLKRERILLDVGIQPKEQLDAFPERTGLWALQDKALLTRRPTERDVDFIGGIPGDGVLNRR
jgi:hypothetical protein